MTMTKSFILGSAAGLIAMSGAGAADLPLKAKAVEYVKVCSLYGSGFFYVPGTDTCIKLGGYLRSDLTIHGGTHHNPYWNGAGGAGGRDANGFNWRSRMAVTIDTRTATEYGVVRTFGQGDWQWSTGDVPGGGAFALEHAFVQFAGFTFGKSASAYSTPWNGGPGNNTSYLIGGNDTSTGVNNVQYTFDFGNGLSASLGVDEPIAYDRTVLGNLGAFGSPTPAVLGTVGNGYGGQDVPDFVGRIRLDQAWGLVQLSGAAHQLNAAYYGANELTGHPDNEWGFAVQGALELRNLPTGPGDRLRLDATYADGATRYVIATSGTSPSFAMFDSGSGVAYQGVGFGFTSDGLYGVGSNIEKTRAWGLRGAYTHNWNRYWQTDLFGSYSSVNYNETASTMYCAGYRARVAGAYGCDPDFNIYQVGLRTGWTPVKNLTLSAEVMYAFLDQSFDGAAVMSPGGVKPTAVYSFGDQGTTSVNFRIQRNF
ncbi:porin [Afipia sp. Root123D2]|uniref:porin n=1 Tax=Afipia sp. Root123D2 TaxID=1736436 RepID=UPI0019103032|nr:porin [Afipia sp. Root123D2]